MFSRRGVELPLVGGPPQRLGWIVAMPSCAWISRALVERCQQDIQVVCVRGCQAIGRNKQTADQDMDKRKNFVCGLVQNNTKKTMRSKL